MQYQQMLIGGGQAVGLLSYSVVIVSGDVTSHLRKTHLKNIPCKIFMTSNDQPGISCEINREGEEEGYRNLKSNMKIGIFLQIFWRQAKLLIWIII